MLILFNFHRCVRNRFCVMLPPFTSIAPLRLRAFCGCGGSWTLPIQSMFQFRAASVSQIDAMQSRPGPLPIIWSPLCQHPPKCQKHIGKPFSKVWSWFENRFRSIYLGQRGKRRLQKALQFMEKWAPKVQQAGTNVPSYLELASLTPESLAQYLRSLGLLSALSDCSEMPIAKVDDLMCRFMNQHFLVGRKPWKGEKAMASLLCFQPAVARHSSELVRSWRALKGWKKLSPSFSRHPRVWAIWCGIAVRLIRHGKWRLAVTTLVAVAAYLRVKERMRIRCGDFLPPTSQGANHWCLSLHPQGREEVSKTGLMDENVTFSTPLGLWMAPLFQHFHQLPKEQMLLQGTYAEHLADFKLATSQLGVPDVQLSETRHSGASIDVAKKHRNIDAVAKQGRWLSVKSLRRYERAGELNRSWNKLSAAQRIYFEKCEEEIAAAVLYGRLPPDLVTNFAQGSGSLRRPGRCDAQDGTASVRSKRVAPTSNSTVAQKRGVASAIRRG